MARGPRYSHHGVEGGDFPYNGNSMRPNHGMMAGPQGIFMMNPLQLMEEMEREMFGQPGIGPTGGHY